MSADEFREIALSLPEAIEAAHVGHPDFRVRGIILATLGLPDQTWGMAVRAESVGCGITIAWLNVAPKRLRQLGPFE